MSERYVVERAETSWRVVDTRTGKTVAEFDITHRKLAHLDAEARNRPTPLDPRVLGSI